MVSPLRLPFGTAALLCTLAVVPLVSCSSSTSKSGNALHAYLPGGLVFFTHAKAGGRYGIGFPILKNKTSSPVTVKQVRLVHVPDGIQVIGYRAGKVGGPGAAYTSYEGTGQANDYLHYPNLIHSKYTTIPPHAAQRIFFAADLRVQVLTSRYITGCQVTYQTRGQTRQQTFHCQYAMSNP